MTDTSVQKVQESLKPCPFCGHNPEWSKTFGGAEYVSCDNDDCACSPVAFASHKKTVAITAWNTRTPSEANDLIRVRNDAIRDFCERAQIPASKQVSGLPDDIKIFRAKAAFQAKAEGNTQESPELEPCPFCGQSLVEHLLQLEGDPYRLFQHSGKRSQCIMATTTVIKLKNGDYPNKKKTAYTYWTTEEWNTRAPSEAEQAIYGVVKALRGWQMQNLQNPPYTVPNYEDFCLIVKAIEDANFTLAKAEADQ